MCEMSMALNNGLISAEKETCGMGSPFGFQSTFGRKPPMRNCARPAGSCGEENAGQPCLRSSVDAILRYVGTVQDFRRRFEPKSLSNRLCRDLLGCGRLRA